jgi:hypothetical protein
MSGPNETTEKLFPPPENPNPDAPIPLGPSIRIAFKEHKADVAKTLAAYELRLEGFEARLPAAVSPQSVLGVVKGGVLKAGKVTPILLLLGEAAAQIATALGHTTWVGPIRFITGLFGG